MVDMIKADTHKFLEALAKRADRFQEKMKSLPERNYKGERDDYFYLLERRNETLNEIVDVLNDEVGLRVAYIRIHQKDATYIYDAIQKAYKILEKSL